MTVVLSTLTAVLGTLLGVVVTHLFQRASARQSQSFAALQQLRSERLTVYSDFAGAVTDFRRGQQDRWHRRAEDPDGSACFEARLEAYRLRGVALHALFRVQLIASSQALFDAAQLAYELTSGAHKASSHAELGELANRARQALERFIAMASSDIR
ncbi:hypothetical protein ACTWP5_11365 [Streptomyces sp. 4N509B]|uniref:hypothetical protein n=1 Tax=Streptomyces sp. 4N509B TaxID=3457413 RepID=UPI003FCF771E